MSVRSTPLSGHLTGTGSQEIRRVQLWQLTDTPSSPTAGLFWQNSNAGNKRAYFYDDELAAAVPVPRLDRNETITGQWSISPGGTQAPLVLGTNAQGQKVVGLNADQLDGRDSSSNPTANTIALRDSNGALAVEDPTGLTDAVNLQYLNDALDFLTISASQVTAGLLALTRGGTNADLSGAATGGLVYKGASALSATAALTGVLIGNGAGAPSALAALTVGLGGTGGTTPATARTGLDVMWADDVLSHLSARAPRSGVVLDGSAAFRINGTNKVPIGLNDFTVQVLCRLRDYTPAADMVLWAATSTVTSAVTHARLNLTTAGVFRLIIGKGDGSGVDYSYDFAPDVPLVDGQTYWVSLSVDRDGNGTLAIHGVSDRDKNGTSVTASVATSAGVDIAAGTIGAWAAGYSVIGEILGLSVLNYAATEAEISALVRSGQVSTYGNQWGSFTPMVDSATLNGGFETAGGGGADDFGSWLESEAGSSTVTRDTAVFYAGAASCRFDVDGSGSACSVSQAILTPGKRYRVRFWARHNGTAANVQVFLGFFASGVTNFYVPALTGTWTRYEFSAIANGTSLTIGRASGQASKQFWVDDLEVVQEGAVLDLDFQNANPAVSTVLRDRSSFNNHGTLNASTSFQPQAVRQLNIVDQLSIGALTSNAVLYNSASGGGVTGLAQNSSATPKFLYQVSSTAPQWLDLYAQSITWTGTHAFAGYVTVLAPVSALHPATKQYVDDAVSAGFRLLAGGPVKAKTTGNITLSGTQTIDGVALGVDESCLVNDQSAPAQNGVYLVKSGAWVRRTDADTAAEITKGAYVFVQFGTVNAGSSWVQGATVTTLGSDAIAFTQFFQQTAYTAGSGIAIAGLSISINLAASLAWTGAQSFASASGVALQPHGTSAGNTTALRFYELAANGANYVGFKAADTINADVVWTLPSVDGAANQYLKTNGAGVLSFGQITSGEISNSHFVTGLAGTAGRIAVTGSGIAPTVDIDSGYAGQASITTLGTITAGTWSATAIGATKGGTGQTSYTAGDLLYAANGTTLAKLGLGATPNAFLIVGASVPAWSSYALPATVSANSLLYGASGSAVAALAAVANRVLTTDGAGTLAWRNTLPAGLSVEGETDSKIVKMKWFNVGNGIDQTITLSHLFNTYDVKVTVYENSGDRRSYDLVPVSRPTVNTVQLEFTEVPTAAQFRACVEAQI